MVGQEVDLEHYGLLHGSVERVEVVPGHLHEGGGVASRCCAALRLGRGDGVEVAAEHEGGEVTFFSFRPGR